MEQSHPLNTAAWPGLFKETVEFVAKQPCRPACPKARREVIRLAELI